MKFAPVHVVIMAVTLIVALTVLVALGKLPESSIAAPLGWFVGWLMKSPIPSAPVPQ